MHLNPESLSFALLISDLGSIARAANILGMKQATLSRKLTALESRVGVRLFDRSTRGRAYRLWGRVSESSAPDRGGSGHTPHLESRSGKW
jgi:predicted ArsR family transcriptional regulator